MTKINIKSQATISGEQLLAMGDIGRCELVRGKIIRLPYHGHWHGYYEAAVGFSLSKFVRGQNLGVVLGGEAGVYTQRNPDTVRGMDVAFISNERMNLVQEDGFLDVAPELIVEVMSPNDRWIDIHEKLAEYFNIGVLLVWLVDPQLEQVHVYRSLDDMRRLTAENELTAPEILPGFSVSVAEIFETAE